MSPRHVLRAYSLAVSTILRSTPKFRRWEAKWSLGACLEGYTWALVPLFLSASHLWRGKQPLPYDPAATIQDDGLKSPTLWAQTRPLRPAVVFTYSVMALTSWHTLSPSFAEPKEIAQVKCQHRMTTLWDWGARRRRGCFDCNTPCPILLHIYLCITWV